MAKWGPPPGINTAPAISLYINTDLKIQVCMTVINWHGCFVKSTGTRTSGSPSSFTELHKRKILSQSSWLTATKANRLLCIQLQKKKPRPLSASALTLSGFVTLHAAPRLSFASSGFLLLDVLWSCALSQWRQNNKQENKTSGPKWKLKRGCLGLLQKWWDSIIWSEGREERELHYPIRAGLFTLCPGDKICCKNTGNDINRRLREIIRVVSWRQKKAGTDSGS